MRGTVRIVVPRRRFSIPCSTCLSSPLLLPIKVVAPARQGIERMTSPQRLSFRAISLFFLMLPMTTPRAYSQSSDAAATPATSTAKSSAPSTQKILSKDFTLEGGTVWTAPGITLEPGQHVVVTAEG